MKFSRAHFFLAVSACTALTIALVLSLGGYFRSVEQGGSSMGTEKQLLTQLRAFHDRLKEADSPEQAKAALKLVENLSGVGQESEGARELKKAYTPVLAVFAAKPREAENRYQLGKKRELMENLVNAYRKEIPHGDISVRAAYLNILFDTQSSLLNESDEAEQVYIKRSRERFDSLKNMSARDAALAARVAALDSIFQSYERAFQYAQKWRAEKSEALTKEEGALAGIAKSIYANADSGIDEVRRTFLYVCFLSLIIAGASFLTLYLGFKVLRVRSELKLESFLSYLRVFGSERVDPKLDSMLQSLRADSDWSAVVEEAQRAEEAFLSTCHNLLAVPRSVLTPFLVVGKDKTLQHWNDSATELFGLTEGKEWGMADLLRPDLMHAREGDTDALLELIRNSFASLAEERFELLLAQAGAWNPYELTLSPITSGPMVGGKVVFWREVRNEAARIDRSVATHLARLRDLVHKVTHQYAVELTAREGDVEPVRAMITDLDTMKRKTDEREILWKSEVQALIDQVSRQQEVLHKLSVELSQVRAGHSEALSLVRGVHGGDEHWHDEVCAMERDLERWMGNRQRLLGDLQQQASVLEKVEKFEQQLRIATASVRAELESYDKEIHDLREFSEAARVHSVNLSLIKDPGYWEYASRARAFAHELARFTEKAAGLGEKVRDFLIAHPGNALAEHLNSPVLDQSVVSTIREEQERTVALLRRWKESSQTLITGGEKALALLEDADRKGAVLSQLGETSLLINQQAKGNLERWN